MLLFFYIIFKYYFFLIIILSAKIIIREMKINKEYDIIQLYLLKMLYQIINNKKINSNYRKVNYR